MTTHARSGVHAQSLLVGIAIGVLAIGLLVALVEDDSPSPVSAGADSLASESFDGGPSAIGTDGGAGGGPGVDGDPRRSAASSSPGPAIDEGSTAPAAGGDRPTSSGRGPKQTHEGSDSAPAVSAGERGAIKIGVLLLDIGNVSDLGFPGTAPVEVRQRVWEHLLGELNESGGINGRPIEAVYRTYDPLSESNMRAACLDLTEEENVFLAVASGGFIGPPILCFTQEHATPFIVAGSSGVAQEFYEKSNGLLFTTFMGSDRTVKNLVEEVERIGGFEVEGPANQLQVGILFDLRSGPRSIAELARAEVEARGYEVGRVSVFSADYATAASQVPVEVLEHRAAGVDVILNMSHTLAFTQFVRATNGSEFTYFNWDWNGANSDFYYSNMPDSYDGNLNFTIFRTNDFRADIEEPAEDRKCREEIEAAIGRTVPPDDPDRGILLLQCAFFELTRRGLENAPTPLDRAGFSAGMQSIGSTPLAAFGDLRFGPNQFDAGSQLRTMRWQADCTCIVPISEFRPPRF